MNQLTLVTVKCGVLFEVRTDFLGIIKTSFGFKGLRLSLSVDDKNQEKPRLGRLYTECFPNKNLTLC
jgi:hypothetical protein